MKHRRAIILIGPQGSGKGTQASLLKKQYHFEYIAGGDIARELAKQRTELGAEVRQLMNEGKLLPDRVLNKGAAMMIEHAPAAQSLLFDGYPRTLAQAEFLAGVLKDQQIPIVVVELQLDDAASIARIKSRFVCESCGSILYTYASQHLRPLQQKRQAQHLCIHCGGTLVQRSDDTEASVKERLQLYHRQTKPVIDFFRGLHRVHTVDARPDIETVFKSIQTVLDQAETDHA